MKHLLKKLILTVILCAVSGFALYGCAEKENHTESEPEYTDMELNICVGDTYDFGTMGYLIDSYGGTVLYAVGDVITATEVGCDEVIVSDRVTAKQYRYTVNVFGSAKEVGATFKVDKGMFQGKKVIAFGDSITDGCLLDPNTPDGYNYEDTYFANLCRYLGAASDPTDLKNCNFACGGTALTFGKNSDAGISGVERIGRTDTFTDHGRVLKNPYSNILSADLCIIFYGTNDLTSGVPTASNGVDGLNDRPTAAEDCKTLRGSMYYMLTRLHELNPRMKIIVLPPLYRRADGTYLVYSVDMTDVIFQPTGASLKQYGKAISEVCRETGCMFIDWYPVFNYENFGKADANYYSQDGLHPNVEGHRLMFDYLVGLLENGR